MTLCVLKSPYKIPGLLSTALIFLYSSVDNWSSSSAESGVVYKYTCGRCNSTYYGETDRYLKVRSGEHIGISPLALKKTKHQWRVQFATIF